jgi:hypothetical protein
MDSVRFRKMHCIHRGHSFGAGRIFAWKIQMMEENMSSGGKDLLIQTTGILHPHPGLRVTSISRDTTKSQISSLKRYQFSKSFGQYIARSCNRHAMIHVPTPPKRRRESQKTNAHVEGV